MWVGFKRTPSIVELSLRKQRKIKQWKIKNAETFDKKKTDEDGSKNVEGEIPSTKS